MMDLQYDINYDININGNCFWYDKYILIIYYIIYLNITDNDYIFLIFYFIINILLIFETKSL